MHVSNGGTWRYMSDRGCPRHMGHRRRYRCIAWTVRYGILVHGDPRLDGRRNDGCLGITFIHFIHYKVKLGIYGRGY